mgnify:CR=1 FL=1
MSAWIRLVEAAERQQVLRAATAPAALRDISTCHVGCGRPAKVATITSSMP